MAPQATEVSNVEASPGAEVSLNDFRSVAEPVEPAHGNAAE